MERDGVIGFFRRNLSGTLFCAALLAIVSVVAVAAKFRLDDTALTYTDAVPFSDGWTAVEGEKRTALSGPARGEVSAAGEPFMIEHALPDAFPADAAICIQTKNERVRAYVDGQLIYSYAYQDRTYFGWEFGAVWNLVELPASAAGGTLRLVLTPIAGRTGEAPYPILFGCRNAIVHRLFSDNLGPLITSVLMLLISFGYLYTGVAYAVRNDPRTKAMLYLGLFSLLAAVWSTTDSLLLQFYFKNKAISYLLFACSFYLMPVPFALFMGETVPDHKGLFNNFAAVAAVYFFVRIGLYVFGVLDFETALFVLHLYMGAMILSSLWVLLVPCLLKKSRVNHDLVIGVSVLSVLETCSLISFYAGDKLNMQRAHYASGFSLGFLLYAIIVSVGMFQRNGRLYRQALKSEFYEQRAYIDELTGLLSTRGFDDKAAELLKKHPQRCYAIVDFDINYFEQYNAQNGFEAGTALLLRIRDALVAGRRWEELCARLEADHFAALIYGDDLPDILERVRGSYFRVRGAALQDRILLSYGVVETTDRSLPIATLRYQAALAKATVKGNYERNIAVYDAAMHEKQAEELRIVSGFEDALEEGEYTAFYQPKFDVQTGRLVGAEALVRHFDEFGSMTSPGRFVPLLEERGLIARLDEYIFERVCRFQAQCREDGLQCVPISANFSRVHLYDEGFPDRIAKVAAHWNVPTGQLEIELTESAFLVSMDLLKQTIKRLRANGFKVSIDDFGSGYSSLNMLKDVPVDVIKIDKEFLDNFENSERTRLVMNNILRLANDLGIVTVAEGVETESQLDFLREHRCGIIQGYLMARPMMELDFLEKHVMKQ